MHKTHWVILFLFLSGCATIGVMQWDDIYGKSNPENRLRATAITPAEKQTYHQSVQPIIENRCVVCHGCFDSPCQFKMESPQAIERGGNKISIYGDRITPMEPTYIQDKNQMTAAWREKGFFPILNEREQTPEANLEASVFYQMLKLKEDNPLPHVAILDDSFDFSLTRDQQCPSIEEFAEYKSKTPLGGMPYGLPNIPKNEYDTLRNWLEKGAKMPKPEPMSSLEAAMVKKWESFLNADDLKSQLMARYIYEHLFLANLYLFPEQKSYFKIIRSYTPPGETISTVISRRPYDDPKVERIYYRLQKNSNTIVSKLHMPYRFDEAKLARVKSLFIEPEYEVTTLPSYKLTEASNPFTTFAAIPAKSRYKFMLDEAQFSIMNFIKGPSCRGQVALGVIEDDFWVFFRNPDNIDLYHIDKFLNTNSDLLQMPASSTDDVFELLSWRGYAKRQNDYITAKLEYFKELEIRQTDIDLDLIWNGDGNPNSVLTVSRHFDSASVIKGAVGDFPKTSWVIDYPLLERIHYLLVAGFDIYGSLSHQLVSRLYMDFLRMEAESSFIFLLPKADRIPTFKYWYRDANSEIIEHLLSDELFVTPDSNINYVTKEPQTELYSKLLNHTKGSLNHSYDIKSDINGYKIQRLKNMKGEHVSILPQLSYVMVENANSEEVYSLVNNSGHSNVAHLFFEDKRRLKKEDTLTVIQGIVGSYPNAFFKVSSEELGEFIVSLENIRNDVDYQAVRDKYGIRRTDPSFWEYSDKLHQWYKVNQPKEYGLLDYNRMDNK